MSKKEAWDKEIYKSRRSGHQLRVEEFMRRAKQDLPHTPIIPSVEVRLLRARLILEEALETIDALGVTLEVESKSHFSGAGTRYPVDKSNVKLASKLSGSCDIIGVADGVADISVVSIGTLAAFGIGALPILEEVDRTNLAKFTGDAHKCSETGKWLKPSDWKPPKILEILVDQGYGVP